MKIYTLVLVFFFLCNTNLSYGNSYNNSASSAIVMEVKTGKILYEKNIKQSMAMASTTKIMTALLALENGDINKYIKIDNKAVGVEGSSIYLQHNEKVLMKDLIYGLMLRSGNDSAVAIASHVGGSVEKFIDLMNKKAKEIGAVNTHFMNPNGLHHKNHYTTAYDLALITREALLNKKFSEIVKTKLWIANREGYKYFYNKNKTLTQYEGGDGVKTGYTRAAGRCLVTSATRDGMQLICVVLNDPNWFNDSYSLLDYAFSEYEAHCIVKKGTVIKTVKIQNGKKTYTKVVSPEDIIIPMKPSEKNKLKVIVDMDKVLDAPIARGTKLGYFKVYIDDDLMYKGELNAREDIYEKDFEDKVWDFIKNKIFKK
ncbi:D-alanyl-D-alanine carboxypeptidase [Lutibacter sp. B2]|nr:D-alanyl-D-alanine carboxypeptidase [Lutibacter sp. B2]